MMMMTMMTMMTMDGRMLGRRRMSAKDLSNRPTRAAVVFDFNSIHSKRSGNSSESRHKKVSSKTRHKKRSSSTPGSLGQTKSLAFLSVSQCCACVYTCCVCVCVCLSVLFPTTASFSSPEVIHAFPP